MNQQTPNALNLIEGLKSTPARRYLSEKPISDEILWNILDVAICGPSGGNTQGWAWIVVSEQSTKNKIAEWYREGWAHSYGVRREEILYRTDYSGTLGPRNFLSAEHLANHIQEAPIWIIPVLRNAATSNNPRAGSSIYGAIQNLMLAARAYGIGATLTTLYASHENDVKELLGIPEDAMTMALIPLGYPDRGRWARPIRRAVEQVTYWDSWDNQRRR